MLVADSSGPLKAGRSVEPSSEQLRFVFLPLLEVTAWGTHLGGDINTAVTWILLADWWGSVVPGHTPGRQYLPYLT